MAINCVVPVRDRKFDSDGRVLGLLEPPVYRVEAEGLPLLVARGVMPFRFLELRKDFKSRFKGCVNSADVLEVLKAEGVFDEA